MELFWVTRCTFCASVLNKNDIKQHRWCTNTAIYSMQNSIEKQFCVDGFKKGENKITVAMWHAFNESVHQKYSICLIFKTVIRNNSDDMVDSVCVNKAKQNKHINCCFWLQQSITVYSLSCILKLLFSCCTPRLRLHRSSCSRSGSASEWWDIAPQVCWPRTECWRLLHLAQCPCTERRYCKTQQLAVSQQGMCPSGRQQSSLT